MLTMLKRILLVPLALALGIASAHAAEDGLLPVEQAFKLETKAVDAQRVTLHWQIADGYYLYRDRIKLKSGDANLALGALELGPATKKHDEFLGDVEVYHGTVDATQTISVANGATSVQLKVTVQGCHEVEPKICYPPFPQTIKLDLPAGAAMANASASNSTSVLGADASSNPLAKALAGNSAANSVVTDKSAPLPPEQAFVFETIATSPTEILARWTMPPGYYLYRDKSKVSLHDGAGIELSAARWPAGVQHTDTNFGTTTVYFNQIELPIALQRAASAEQKISVEGEFQGCQENGICYPVMLRDVDVNLPLASAAQLADAKAAFAPAAAVSTTSAVSASAPALSEDQQLAAQLGTRSLTSLGGFFVLGLLLAFTPCVFPMIPILSGIIAGAGEDISTKRAFILSLVYVLASSVVFTIAGVIAGLAGKNLQAAFQNPWVLSSFAALFVLLSLSMFGFYELQLPSSWQSKLANVSNRQRSGSLLGVAVMGVLSALIIGPCVAPPLAAAVLYISQAHDPVFGGLALFVLSLGMGAPLLVFGSAAGKLLPRAGAWMDAVKAVFGVLFLGLAIWMLSRILHVHWIMGMGGALLIACAVYLGALERLNDDASGWRKLWKSLGVLLLILGTVELLGAAAGGRDLLQPLKGIAGSSSAATTELPFKTIKSSADLDRELAAAKAQNKSLMLDFYADWCVSCKEMEHDTFAESSVHQALRNFVLLKADVTANDEADQALMQRFSIIGPPGTLFFGKEGAEKRTLRLTGPEAADKFVQRIAAAR